MGVERDPPERAASPPSSADIDDEAAMSTTVTMASAARSVFVDISQTSGDTTAG
jgi:hypothetical protein